MREEVRKWNLENFCILTSLASCFTLETSNFTFVLLVIFVVIPFQLSASIRVICGQKPSWGEEL